MRPANRSLRSLHGEHVARVRLDRFGVHLRYGRLGEGVNKIGRLRRALARAIGHVRLPVSTERIVRRLAPPRLTQGSFEVPFSRLRYQGELGSFIDWSVYFFGAYAAHELHLLDRVARNIARRRGAKPVFADIGANVGNHTLFMSSRASRIVAFEPFPPVRSRLLDHVRINGLSHVTVLPVALGDTDGTTDFYHVSGHDNAGIGTTVQQRGWSRMEVDRRRGDTLRELNDVDIIKVDVEGAEAAVLKGLSETLRRRRPVILMELSDASRRAFGNESVLRAALYDDAEIYAVRPGRLRPVVLRPFRFDEADEILVAPPGLL